MSIPARCLSRTLFQVSRRIPAKRKCTASAFTYHRGANRSIQHRQLCTSFPQRADNRNNSGPSGAYDEDDHDDEQVDFSFDKEPEGGYKTPTTPITLADLDADEVADYEMLTPKDRASYLRLQNHYAAEFEEAGIDTRSDPDGELPDPILDKVVDDLERQIDKEMEPLDFPDVPLQARDKGFWALDEEDDELAQVEDGEEEWDESAISSVAQNELDLHREVREYTRVIAWDMPLLQSKCSFRICCRRRLYPNIILQNSPNHSRRQQMQHPSASATRPTWANTIPRPAKSFFNSLPRTSPT